MRRKAHKLLEAWSNESSRKPLIIRGARQVGKSTLVRLFAESSEFDLLEINLEKTTIKSFESEDLDIEQIIQEIEYKTRKEFSDNTLLFIDEIQEQPRALLALRYFFEEKKNLRVIAAGSLLEFVLNDHDFSLPVGRVEYLHLGPMTFEEYLLAGGNKRLVEDLNRAPLKTSIDAFDKLSRHLREFYFVGGMPEAVDVFLKTKSTLAVEKVHRSILETTVDDFAKYSTKAESVHLKNIFRNLPNCIGKKVKYSGLLADVKQATIKNVLSLLEHAKLVIRCNHSNASGIPLSALADETTFKLFFLDIGLLNHLQRLSAEDILSLSENLLTEGAIAEQFIAQHLKYFDQRSAAEPLYYWLRNTKIGAAEIDFIIQRSKMIIPIEVKAGKSGTLKSLNYFMTEKNLKTAFRFDLKERSLEEMHEKISTSFFDGKAQRKSLYTLISVPLYLIEYLNHLI